METALKIRQQAVEQARIMKELSSWENSQSKAGQSPKTDPTQITSEKIKSFEYGKWDKFDVEEALANVDSENPTSKELTPTLPILSLEDSLFEKEKGNAYFAKSKFKKAIQCYTKSIGFNANSAVSYLNRSLAFIKLGMFEEAANDASKAMELEPKNVKAFWRRGIAYRELSKFKESKKDFEMALVFEPTNSSILKDLRELKYLIEKTISKEVEKQTLISISKTSVKQRRKRIIIREIHRGETNKIASAAEKDSHISIKKDCKTFSTTKEELLSATNISEENRSLSVGSFAPGSINSLYKFETAWKSLDKNLEGRRRLLESIESENLAIIFKDSLEISYLSDIIDVVVEYFVEHNLECGAKLFAGVCKLPRFKMVSMLLPKGYKEKLKFLNNKFA